MVQASPLVRSAGPVAPRPWWQRAAQAVGAALLVQVAATLLLHRILPAPWNSRVPMSLALAVFFTYHPQWRERRYLRPALVQAALLFALGMAVWMVAF